MGGTLQLELEHLPADALGLEDHARRALAEGARGGLPVVRSPGEIPRPADRHDLGARTLLADALRRGLAEGEVPQRVSTSLNVLARPGTFCVVTGQQPGFLCAPLYSLYKALQACRLAHELSGSWGTPVVPLFWNHADDHDVAEVHHAWQLNRNLDLQRVGLAGLSSGRQPLSRIVLDGEQLGSTRAQLAQTYEEFPGTAEALEWFFPRPGETLARAFTRAFTTLLGEHGLVMVEPDWIRSELSSALADLVGRDPLSALREGSGAPSATGPSAIDPPAIDPEGAALVYRVDEDGRRPLRAGGEGFRFDGEPGSRRADELAAEIVDEPQAYSPGALLRPLVQDAVLPVCAYVGGWGELGYHAQLVPLRERAGLPVTPFVPRLSATLVDPELRTSLERCGFTLREALAAKGEVAGDTDGSQGPPVAQALRDAAEEAARRLLDLRPDLGQVEPALAANLKKTAAQVRSLVDKLARKAERVHANRSGKGHRHLRRVRNTLFPRGEPQERVLGPLGTTARFGRAWIEALYAELPPAGCEHLVVHLEPEESP